MKIWILTSETPHFWAGGIARYVDNFSRAATAAGHEITVVSRGERRRTLTLPEGYRLHEFVHRYEAARVPDPDVEPDAHPGWPYNNMAYFAALSYQYAEEIAALVEREGAPDVIECQDYAALGYFLLQRKLTEPQFLENTPVVIHLHTPDFAVQEVNQYPRYKLPDYWIGRMERAAIRMADALLAPSRFIASGIGRWLEGDVPAVAVIPYPWAGMPAGFGASPAPGIEDRLICPGRIELRKGVEPLLEACEELWREGARFVLEMAGGDVHTPLKGGSLKGYLEKRYRHRIQSGNLTFHGSLTHEECLHRMGEATAVVIPSLWENFPNTCIEAMALGKLVLASSSGGQAEMLGESGSAGILFRHDGGNDFKEALALALRTSPARRAAYGQAAQERIARLCHPDAVVPLRIAHFREVVEKTRPPSRFPFSNERFREGPAATPLPDDPLVSVIIPYYNLGPFLGECVASVLASEEVRMEVIVVNDGSTDPDSIKKLKTVREAGHPGLRVLDIPNGGLANARNVGAAEARGELLAFVDADDTIGPLFLDRAVGVLRRYANVHLVYSWVRFFGEGKGIWHSWTFDLPYLLCHNQLVPIAVVRRETFLRHGRNKPHIVYGLEDYESWISLAEAGCGGVAIPEPLVQYRIRTNSMFKVIEPDKKLYLYDLISHEHPELYREYGLELFNLENANGPAYGWDQPTMFKGPQERLLGKLNRAETELSGLREELGKVREAETWLQKERRRLSELAGVPLDSD